MAETPSPRQPQDSLPPPKMTPGQWVLLIVGTLLHGAGSTLMLTAAVASLVPEPSEWRFRPYHRVDYMAEWDPQQATQWWEQLQDTIPTPLIIGAAAFVAGVVALLFGAAGLGRDIDPQHLTDVLGGARDADVGSHPADPQPA